MSNMLIIMGLPRSGTTWLGKIFDSHPETFYSHEPDTRRFRDVPLFIASESADAYRAGLVREIETFRDLRTLRVVGKLPLFPKRREGRSSLRLRALALVALKSVARVVGELRVPRFVSGSPDEAAVWVWKSIESSGRLGAIARALPTARIIFIIRHPCGVTASLKRGEAGAHFSAGPASEDFGFYELLADTEPAQKRGLTIEAFRKMSAIERVAWRWALMNDKVMSDVARLSSCRILRYEDLCTDPLMVTREIFDFAGLRWDVQVERFVQASTAEGQSDYYSVFKNPVDSANRWREELSADVRDIVLETVADTAPGRLYIE